MPISHCSGLREQVACSGVSLGAGPLNSVFGSESQMQIRDDDGFMAARDGMSLERETAVHLARLRCGELLGQRRFVRIETLPIR